jgi:hypothetical protein
MLPTCQNHKFPSPQTHHHHGFPVLFSRSLENLGEPYRRAKLFNIDAQRHSDTTVGRAMIMPLRMRIEPHMKATMKFPHTGSWKEAAPARGRGVVGGFECVLLWGVGTKLRAQVAKSCPQNKKAAPHSQTDDLKEHVAETVPHASRLRARHAQQRSRHPCHRPFHARLWQWCLLRLHPDVHERCPWSRHEGKKMSQTQRCRTLLQATSVTVSTPPRSPLRTD